MDPVDVTAVYALSRAYVPYLRRSLATLPPAVRTVVTWCHEEPFPTGFERAGLEFVRAPPMPDNFCKSRALNVAIRRATTPWVLVADADMLFPGFFLAALAPDAEGLSVRRFYVARFTPDFTRRVLAGELAWDRDVEMFASRNRAGGPPKPRGIVESAIRRLLPPFRVVFDARAVCFLEIYGSPNPVLYPRSLLEELGGYDEDISGWGGEDLDLHRRGLLLGAREERLPLVVGHLEHPPVSDFPRYRSHGNGHDLLLADRPARANPGGWGQSA